MISRRRRRQDLAISQINVTSLVDVTLVTLIIFMLIAPIIEHGIDVRLPKASPQKISHEKPVTVSMSQKGIIYMNNVVVTRTQLEERLSAMVSSRPNLPVIIRAEDKLPYGEIISIIDIVKKSGVVNLGLATRVES
jgi:biopolymer transport protein TolR